MGWYLQSPRPMYSVVPLRMQLVVNTGRPHIVPFSIMGLNTPSALTGSPSSIAAMLLVIVQQRCSPSMPVSRTFAFMAFSSLNVGTEESVTLVERADTNGPTRLVAPLTLVVEKRILLMSLATAAGISSRTIVSMRPEVWLMVSRLTGIAMPMRSGDAVSLLISMEVSDKETPSPTIEASTASYTGHTYSPASPVGIESPTLFRIRPSSSGLRISWI